MLQLLELEKLYTLFQLKEVLKQANFINNKSNGYFDITADPLIELWGFGYKKKRRPYGQRYNKPNLVNAVLNTKA